MDRAVKQVRVLHLAEMVQRVLLLQVVPAWSDVINQVNRQCRVAHRYPPHVLADHVEHFIHEYHVSRRGDTPMVQPARVMDQISARERRAMEKNDGGGTCPTRP